MHITAIPDGAHPTRGRGVVEADHRRATIATGSARLRGPPAPLGPTRALTSASPPSSLPAGGGPRISPSDLRA
ncbi:MAG: hypothetical protein JWP46_4380 [Modestobacter sp.]|nr:hypothetical protein [Modestobacter sp.]